MDLFGRKTHSKGLLILQKNLIVAYERYLIEDLTFDDRMWVSREALEDESSGYFLVPEGVLPKGWRPVDPAEAASVWGRGNTNGNNPENITSCNRKLGGCSTGSCTNVGVAGYSFHAMMVNLNITDTPVGYSPPRGPRVDFLMTYNQRESFQPGNFNYSNLGQKWTFDWLSYVTDNPGDSEATSTVYARGGGQETYTKSGGNYEIHFETYAELVQTFHSDLDAEYERRLPDGSVEVFSQVDGTGTPRKVFMTEWRDPQGNKLTFSYDANMRLWKVTDAINQDTILDYGDTGDIYKITKVTDEFGRSAEFHYTDGRLERITDVIGMESSFEYGTEDFISAMTTPYGRTTFTRGEYEVVDPELGARQRWLEATDPLGGRERIEYISLNDTYPSQAPAAEVPAGLASTNNGFHFRNSYYWSKLAMERYPGDYTQAEVLHWLKDKDINVTSGTLESRQMPLVRVWYKYPDQAQFNQRGSSHQPTLIARVLDDGTTQKYQYEYNALGKVTKSIDPVGRETVFEYAANAIDLLAVKQKNGANYELLQEFGGYTDHQPATVTDAAGQTTSYTYNAFGQLETITTPERAGVSENRTTTYSYDADGYLDSVTGPATGATTSYTYDLVGRVRTVTDSDEYTLTYDYDDLDRVTKVTYPDATFEETVYDKLDATATRDRSGRWTLRVYDALRRMTSTRDPLGRTVTQEWCRCGSLDALLDANGNKTRWERDLQGRVTKEIRANDSEWTYTYGVRTGCLLTATDPKDQVKTYDYFLDDNLEEVSYTNEEHETPDVSFTYDDVYNRVETMVDGTGTTSYTYHPITTTPDLGAGRLATVNGPLANDEIAYTYDELGRVESRAIDSVALSYDYDALGRITEELNALGTFTYDYEGVTSRLSLVTYPNGQTTSYAYYGNAEDRRLLEIHHKKPGGVTLSKFGYTYDDVGNILNWSQQADTDPPKAYDLEYDFSDQLRAATWRTTDPTPTILKRYRYAYDPAGNRTAEQIDDTPVLASYDEMNRLQQHLPGGEMRFAGSLSEQAAVTIESVPAAVSGDNRFELGVSVTSGTNQVEVKATDPAGNVRTNTYDVSVSGSTKTFTFDANGNMTGDGTRTFEWDAENRLVTVTQGPLRNEFAFDGQSRRTRIVERDDGVSIADRRFVWCGNELCEERDSDGSTVVTSLFERGETDVTTPYFYTLDHQWSVRELTDGAAAIRGRYEYGAFGRTTKVSGDLDSIARYGGYFAHDGSGLSLAVYRAYDPELGRWLDEDPTALRDGVNRYRYAWNDPVALMDSLGLQAESTQSNQKKSGGSKKDEDLPTVRLPAESEVPGEPGPPLPDPRRKLPKDMPPVWRFGGVCEGMDLAFFRDDGPPAGSKAWRKWNDLARNDCENPVFIEEPGRLRVWIAPMTWISGNGGSAGGACCEHDDMRGRCG